MSKGTLKQKQQTQDKERQAYAFYVSQGWTPEQAIGIVGNLIRESNLNTTIVGTADDKGSQGIAQWHGDRLKTLKSKYGNNWTDFRNQLEFVDWELKNTEKAAGDKLRKTKGVWEAGTIVSDHYERPKVKFVGDEKRQSHVSDLAMKFKGIKLTPEDMPYANATYANSVAPYMNQQKETVTNTINNFDFLPQNTTFASVPDSVEKEETKTEEDKDVAEVEQKTKEFNFLDEVNTTTSFFKPREKQQNEPPQTDYIQQYEQISQFIENPQVAQQGKKFKLQDERNLVVRDNTPNTKRDLSLMLAEYNNAKKDEQELRTTGQIKNPNSIQYRRNVRTQPDIKQDNISTEQRNAPLNPLQRPLIYLANPEKVLGDLGVPGMETSELDRQAINANRFNPYQSGTDRFLNNAKIGLGYVPEATVNTALAAAFMPEGSGALGLVNETLNPLAGIKTSIPDGMKQGLNSQGFLDIFKSRPKFSIKDDHFYRSIGIDDAVSSGTIRSKQIGDYAGKNPYFVEGTDFDKLYSTGAGATSNKPEYIFEMPMVDKSGEAMTANKVNQNSGYAPYIADKNQIPLSEGSIYKLNSKGEYEVFSIPKPTSNFKSEINWSKWNKEIPENTQLMKEYNTIEQTSKANGSWMKNPDGSTFQGTPEQFVQQNSQNFKKAYPEGYKTVYRGMPYDNPLLLQKENFTGVFTGDKNLAKGYGSNLYELGLKNSNNSISFNANGDDWLDLRFANRDVVTQQKNIDFNKKYLNDLITKEGNSERVVNMKENILRSEKALRENKNALNNQKYQKLTNSFKDESVVITDDIAQYLEKEKLDNIQINNVLDGEFGDINISNQVPGNYLKSLKGNNGMFDMNNPNIYKSIVPLAGASYLATQGQEQNPPQFQQGGQQKFTENELAFLSEIAIKDNNGQRSHPNKVTKIEGNVMATDGYGDIPLYVIPNKGKPKVVNANTGQHKFKGATEFIEIPLFKK